MERGAPPADSRPCNLVEITKEVVETCRPHLESLGIKVELAIATETLPIEADRDSIAQIVLNLISNAEKYGGKEIRIEAGRAEDKNSAQPTATVTVLDRGPGIPASQVKEIFKPFHRLDDSLSTGASGSDLVVLHTMIPALSGYDVCKQLRSHGYPGLILMLTARGQELDKVIGLNLGADDYVTKPFGLRELTARVHALLRRSPQPQDTLTFADCTVDAKTFELRRGERIVSLTAREVKLFQIFITHPNEVLSRDRLLSEAWGHEYYGTTRTLDQTVVQLRKKLSDVEMDPKQIATVHGAGYRWVGVNR